MEGKNNFEIAEIIQISVNKVKNHNPKARKTLKNILDKILYFRVILCKSVIFVPAKYLCGFAKNRMKNIFLVDRFG